MSNLSILDKSIINDKIIIEDDSNDSFNSFYSTESSKNKIKKKSIKKQSIQKQPIKKSFINKINDDDNSNKPNVITPKTPKFKSGYNKKNYTLVNKTKEILEKSYEDYQNALKKYYDDVLKWMNMLYNDDSKSIAKIKFKKMTLNEEIFNLYNEIIKKYKLNKDLFETENFNINDDHDRSEIFLISKILTNNLLAKLGCKLIEYKSGDSKRLKINNTIDCY